PNTFFTLNAGFNNTTSQSNSSFGAVAGQNNTTGSRNIFIGPSSGLSNTIEDNNTYIGTIANGAVGITNATALGYRAQVTQSDSLVLGGINGFNGATADTKVGIGTTSPGAKLDVVGDARVSSNLTVHTNALFVNATND